MTAFWQPEMQWRGPPCGIGSARGIRGFERHHQQRFLTAFPDREGGHHRARFGEGRYAASTGWPSIHATHAGPNLGTPASGLRAENWVLIDLPHLFLQIGADLLAPLKR